MHFSVYIYTGLYAYINLALLLVPYFLREEFLCREHFKVLEFKWTLVLSLTRFKRIPSPILREQAMEDELVSIQEAVKRQMRCNDEMVNLRTTLGQLPIEDWRTQGDQDDRYETHVF